jgi:hypothetical protein
MLIHQPGALSGERGFRGEAFVQQATQGVDVDAPVHGPAVEQFGGHISHGSDGLAGLSQRGLGAPAEGAHDAEVHEIDEVAAALAGHEYVGGFDVPVHQVVIMSGVQGIGDLGDNVDSSLRAQRSVLGQKLGQVEALHKRHTQVQAPIDLTEV